MTITVKSKVVLNILWILIAVGFWWTSVPYSEARTFDPIGPHIFPQIMSGVIILCSLGNLAVLYRHSRQGIGEAAPETFEPANALKMFLVLVVSGLYIWLMPLAGYLIATIFLLFLVIAIQGEVSLKMNILVSCGFALVLYLIFFKVLHILLPHGFLEFI
ncbi:tripartite tricarboxylate transporter TctB family protein [Aminivibrio sp.]|jgi:hypothetical protein|uniref:tripartite tricarboxylate transporter TctB family protein n=1 Tax=Aminivibrio sp. TaxID=1872489 RepID=UPI001A4AACD9|nr:tripartite tricarboxylate transporter TctB family protein [Aminivibrio sp.]MBL3539693.1 tripartite tricarboxylate transporter TctB family protein [Aminivibrio sp.]MDK2959000.1 Tripartite tricarboxylate transporter TctB family [Synergistaceae bacterium]